MPQIYIPMNSSPEHANAFGRFMAYWAVVEVDFSMVLAKLLRTDELRARMIYLEFPSLGAKCSLVRRLLYAYLDDGPKRQKLLELIQDFQDLSATRNTYAHAIWGAAPNDKALTIIHGTLGNNPRQSIKEPLRVPIEDLEADIEKVDRLLTRFHQMRELLPAAEVREQPQSALASPAQTPRS